MEAMKNLMTAAVLCMAVAAATQTPDSVYTLHNGVVVVEPENGSFNSSYWQKRTSPSGYKGSGWLYVSDGGRTGSGECHNVATVENCMTPENAWIEIPIYLPSPQAEHGAIIGMDVRAYRDRDGDGSNDVWVGIKDVTATLAGGTSGYAFRIGCSTQGYNFCWGAINPTQLPNQGGWAYWSLQQPGVYTFFVSGRSNGFGVDRVVVYQVPKAGTGPGLTDLQWPDAWNTSLSASQLQAYGDVVGVRGAASDLTVSQSNITARMLPSGVFRLEGSEPGDELVLTTLRGRTLVRGIASNAMQLPAGLTSGTFLFSLYRNGSMLTAQRVSLEH
ncbi:MAG: hypothetical protein GF331_12395 [Chitinivibrionales bacterium]|nr:hypothetical protein [Chitinivibrionales bacterium]